MAVSVGNDELRRMRGLLTRWSEEEIDVVKVQVGQKVSIVLDALPGQTLSGEVSHIQQFFEEKRGDVTYTVTAVLSQPVSQMRWGMTSAVQFLP